jgi:hypothetical protein
MEEKIQANADELNTVAHTEKQYKVLLCQMNYGDLVHLPSLPEDWMAPLAPKTLKGEPAFVVSLTLTIPLNSTSRASTGTLQFLQMRCQYPFWRDNENLGTGRYEGFLLVLFSMYYTIVRLVPIILSRYSEKWNVRLLIVFTAGNTLGLRHYRLTKTASQKQPLYYFRNFKTQQSGNSRQSPWPHGSLQLLPSKTLIPLCLCSL